MRKIFAGRRSATESSPFTFAVDTTKVSSTPNFSSGANTFVIPAEPPPFGSFSFTIGWGDGSSSNLNSTNYNTARTHTYAVAGTYTIKISGTVRGFNFDNIPAGAQINDRDKLINISIWGGFQATDSGTFQLCSNFLEITATDTPGLVFSGSLRGMFTGCDKLTTINNIKNWNVSICTDTISTFQGCRALEFGSSGQPDLSGWDVSNMTQMRSMFGDCNKFNGQLFTLPASVSDIQNMFNGAYVFNNGGNSPPIDNWDVSSCTNFTGLFFQCENFNRPVNSWNTSSVTSMRLVFGGIESSLSNAAGGSGYVYLNVYPTTVLTGSGDGNLTVVNESVPSGSIGANLISIVVPGAGYVEGDTFTVNGPGTNITGTVGEVRSTTFNQPLNNWDTSNVTDMTGMFQYNHVFDQDISSWNVNGWSVFTSLGIYVLAGHSQGDGFTLSTTNYDALLVAWDAYSFPSLSGTGTVYFGNSQYSLGTAAETARTSLIAKWGAISDGGGV